MIWVANLGCLVFIIKLYSCGMIDDGTFNFIFSNQSKN